MRYHFGFDSPSPYVTTFLIAIIASYLFFALFGHQIFGIEIYNALVLNPYKTIYNFQLWRLVSYAFIHDQSSPFHIIFNALILYTVGTPMENRWGERRFFIFIMGAIIFGGLSVVLTFLLGLGHASVVGFSAATIALIIAWGLTFSKDSIYIFGILPLSGKQLVLVTIGLEVLFALSGSNTSSAAHFGGIFSSFVLIFGLYKPSGIRQLWRHFKMKNRR
jgi:membrane associated rhomboid family serine protease